MPFKGKVYGRHRTDGGRKRITISHLKPSAQVRLNLEDLNRSSDLLNNVKIGQGQLRLITETYFVLPYVGVAAILVK